MKQMYIAQNNAMNFIVIRDMNAADNDTAIADWDLSDDEIKAIAKKFDENEDDPSIFVEEPVWEPFDKTMSNMSHYQTIYGWRTATPGESPVHPKGE